MTTRAGPPPAHAMQSLLRRIADGEVAAEDAANAARLLLADDEPVDRAGLPARERRLLEAVEAYQRTHGRPPSAREAADALGYGSHRSVLIYADRLVARGFLARGPGNRGLIPRLGLVPPARPTPIEDPR